MINPGTPVSAITPVLYMVDQVLVMTVNPGFGGQKFLPETVKKIAELNEIKNQKAWTSILKLMVGSMNTQLLVPIKQGQLSPLPDHTFLTPTTQLAESKQ